MRCPRDNHQLNRRISEHVFGDGCNECNGVFIMGKKIQTYQYNIEKQILENTVQPIHSGDSKLLCPDCQTNMNITMVDNIEIDICKKCLGVWFDKSEAQAILKKYNQDASQSDSKNSRAPFPSEFVHLLSKWFLHKPLA